MELGPHDIHSWMAFSQLGDDQMASGTEHYYPRHIKSDMLTTLQEISLSLMIGYRH